MGAEIVEDHMEVVLPGGRMVADDVLDALDEGLDRLGGRVVGHLYDRAHAPVAAHAHVVDRGHGHFAAGDGDDRVVEGAQAGAAEADVLDHALLLADLDPIADPEGTLEHDHHGAQEVRQRLASGERDGEASDAEAREHRVGGQAQVLGRGDEQRRDHGDGQHPEGETDELTVHAARAQVARRDHEARDLVQQHGHQAYAPQEEDPAIQQGDRRVDVAGDVDLEDEAVDEESHRHERPRQHVGRELLARSRQTPAHDVDECRHRRREGQRESQRSPLPERLSADGPGRPVR